MAREGPRITGNTAIPGRPSLALRELRLLGGEQYVVVRGAGHVVLAPLAIVLAVRSCNICVARLSIVFYNLDRLIEIWAGDGTGIDGT